MIQYCCVARWLAELASFLAGLSVSVLILGLFLAYHLVHTGPLPSFIVLRAERALHQMLHFTPSALIARLRHVSLSDGEIEVFVWRNLILSVAAYLFIPVTCGVFRLRSAFALPLLLYGSWRVAEIILIEAQVAVVARRPVLSYRRSAILALLNYVQVVFWFALTYWARAQTGSHPGLTQLQALRDSLFTMTLFGTKQELGGLQLLQVAIGLFMSVVVLANAIGAIQRGEKGELERMLEKLRGRSITCKMVDGEQKSGTLRGFDDGVVLIDVRQQDSVQTLLIPREMIGYIETTDNPAGAHS